MPIAKVKEMFRFYFSILLLHSIVNIEQKCVFTILKAINCKKKFYAVYVIRDNERSTPNECLIPQGMRECSVSHQFTVIKRAQITSIVIEANHNVVCLFRSSFETTNL